MVETLRPRESGEVERAVSWAAAEEKQLEIIGAGSKRGVGQPTQNDMTLDLSSLKGITLYEPEELVLSARAGTRLSDIEDALRERGQELAFEPADWGPLFGLAPGIATLGGVIAANLSGPRRIKAGAARDHFLGVTAISGRGELFKAGGRVVKNVTGYDLCKVLAGSWGTLAVMTDITVKVLPAAESELSIVVRGADDQSACRAMSAAMGSPCDVSAAAHLPGRFTVLRLEGFGPSIAARAADLKKRLAPFGDIGQLDQNASRALWREVRDVTPFAADSSRPLWRISTAPAQGYKVIDRLKDRLDMAHFYDWAGGLIWLELAGGEVHADLVRGALQGLSGHATLLRADAPSRAAACVFQPQPAGLAALSARVKKGFDPKGVLNAGRMATGQ